MEVSMGWELHIVRTENWFDSASNPIRSEEWIQLIHNDEELSIDTKHGDFFAIWNGHQARDASWLDWDDGRLYTKQPDEALYCKMLQIAKKLDAVVIDDDDRKYLLPSDLKNPSWANSSTDTKKISLWRKIILKLSI
jgi:hypothetical protein